QAAFADARLFHGKPQVTRRPPSCQRRRAARFAAHAVVRCPFAMSEAAPAAFDENALALWLAALRWNAAAVEDLRGDVSPRRYRRLRRADGASAVLALYPANVRATAARFLRTGELLAARGVRVPRVLASDLVAGFVLLEDLGPLTLY